MRVKGSLNNKCVTYCLTSPSLYAAAVLAAVPAPVRACAVCFGAENPRVLKAFYLGTGFLVLTVFSVLFFIVRYIVRSERKKAELYRREGLMDEGESYEGRLIS